jgi:hypothetical protein
MEILEISKKTKSLTLKRLKQKLQFFARVKIILKMGQKNLSCGSHVKYRAEHQSG